MTYLNSQDLLCSRFKKAIFLTVEMVSYNKTSKINYIDVYDKTYKMLMINDMWSSFKGYISGPEVHWFGDKVLPY